MSKANQRKPAGPATQRLNLRAVIILSIAALSIVPIFLGVRYVRGRTNHSSYLAEARRALDGDRLDMAFTYVNSYLQGDPKNLDALDLKGRILAQLARDSRGIEEAIRVQTQILALDPARMEARKRLIELNLRGHLYHGAEAAAEEYLKRGADDAEAHRLMARALEGVGYLGDAAKLDQATVEYEKAEAMKPGDVEGGFRLAMLYRSRGKNPAKAGELIDNMLATNPGSVAAHLAAFRFFLSQTEVADNLARALAELDKALKIAPGDADANLIAAELAVQRGDTVGARARLAAISPPPKNEIPVKLLKGMIEFKEQRPDEGIQSWRSGLIQSGGSDADLAWRLARVLIGLGRLGEARPYLAQYRRLTGGGDQGAEYRYLVALEDLRTGRVKQALAALEAIRDKVTGRSLLSSAQLLTTLGDAYAASRDEARAMDAYRAASIAAGAGAQPWLAMARLQLADRPAEAIASLERGLAAVPDDPSLPTMLAQILLQQEMAKPADRRNWTEFLRRLERAEKVAPNAPEVAMVRADYLYASGQVEEALKRIEEAVARSPSSVGPWLARVSGLTRLNRIDEALDALTAATKAAGDNAQFRVARARLLLRRGETRGAYDVLAQGIDAVPADQKSQLWRALGEYHQGRSDFAAARRAYEEWAKLQPESTEPRLALMNLEIAAADGPAMEAQAEAIRKIVGPDALLGKIARAEVLLKLKRRSPDGRTGEDKARLDEASTLIGEIKAAAPAQPTGLLLEAQLLERLGRTDDQIAAYKAALDLRGGTAALRPLVVLLLREHRKDELDELRKKVASFPTDLDRLATAITLQMGDADAAEQMARRMAQGDPLNLDAAVWMARVLNTLKKPAEAEDTLRQMTLVRPQDPGPWVQLMMFQVDRREVEKARATFNEMKSKVKTERPELLWAACYRALNMRPEADEAFAASLKRWPDDPGVLQAAVDYYEASGRLELAEASLRHLLAVRPGFDWARRRLALNLSARPDDPAALSEALGLVGQIADGSESPEDRQFRAVVLSRSPDPRLRAEAIRILEAVAAESSNATRLHEVLARSLLATGDRARALEHAARAAAPDDASSDFVLFYANLLIQDKNIAGAEAQLARLMKADAKALPTVELRTRILHAKGDDAAADALVFDTFEARKAAPDAIAVGIGLLRLLRDLGRADAAERLGAEVAKLGPKGRVAFAEILGEHGKIKEAGAQYDAASKAGAVDDAARSSLAMANGSGGSNGELLDQADRLLNLALRGRPDGVDLLQSQAYLRHLQRDYGAEIKLYESILAKNPNNYLFLNNMAWTLSEEMGRPEDGLEKIGEALKKVGRQPHLVDTRGMILLRLGRVDEALKDLESAAASMPTAPIYYHLAKAYKAAGKAAEFEKYRDLAREAGLKAEQVQPSERDEAEKLIGFATAGPAAPRPKP